MYIDSSRTEVSPTSLTVTSTYKFNSHMDISFTVCWVISNQLRICKDISKNHVCEYCEISVSNWNTLRLEKANTFKRAHTAYSSSFQFDVVVFDSVFHFAWCTLYK